MRAERRRKTAASAPPEKANRRGLSSLGLLAGLLPAILFFAAGKYLEFRQDDPFDSGAYVYSAAHLLNGGQLGVDEAPSAQPGTLLVNVLGVACFGFNETGPQIIQTFLQVLALAAMFGAVRLLYGMTAAVFSVTAAAAYLSSPHLAKFGNTKEQYMIAMMVLSVCLWIFYEQTDRKVWLILTGAALIWPYYFKATGLSVDAAFAVYFLGRAFGGKIGFRRFQEELGLLLAGAAAGLLPLALFFFWQRQAGWLWNSFPVLVLKAVVLADAAVLAVWGIRRTSVLSRAVGLCRRVRPLVWAAGLIALAAAAAVGSVLVYQADGSEMNDVRSYLTNLFFVKIPLNGWHWVSGHLHAVVRAAGADTPYIADSRRVFPLSRQAPIVFRYYGSVALPIAAALVSLGAALVRFLVKIRKVRPIPLPERIIWLLGLWWLLDAAFVWISPHSYEQYYLPLCASGAMAGAYAVWLYGCRMQQSEFRLPYWVTAAAAVLVMTAMVWPLVFGFSRSPYSGQPYQDPRTGQPMRQRGYVQAFQEPRQTGLWEKIGDYIRTHSTPQDRIYVWGWYPGIYVRAQRLAPTPRAFEQGMHILPPERLAGFVLHLIECFEKQPPIFLVDSRKRHFPFDRPPLELWPVMPSRQGGQMPAFVPSDPAVLGTYEQSWRAFLEKQFGPEEARRFDAMKPLRDYVMAHYRIVQEVSSPYSHVLLERKGR
ncbi:MAG TPA: hypothetical protein PKY88_10910 [Anaerohalosphaeraceae bacterium]|nr:hypothetical protein [Anaerohalosphaeraceae bacterium]